MLLPFAVVVVVVVAGVDDATTPAVAASPHDALVTHVAPVVATDVVTPTTTDALVAAARE